MKRNPTCPLKKLAAAHHGLKLGLAWFVVQCIGVSGAETAATSNTITNPVQVWELPSTETGKVHGLNLRGRVFYFDPEFNMLWLEQHGVGTYLMLSMQPPVLQTGQEVTITGTLVPNVGLEAERVKVTVTDERKPFVPAEVGGRINDSGAFQGRIVRVTGFVDSQQLIDAHHVRLVVVAENRPVICWLRPDDASRVPDWRGKMVELIGLYSARMDLTQTSATLELWLGREDQLRVQGTLGDLPGFAGPVTPIGNLYHRAAGTEIMIRGQVEKQDPGLKMVVSDATGQIEVRSIQQQRLPTGAAVEVVGRLQLAGAQMVVESALYRPATVSSPPRPSSSTGDVLTTIAQVHALGRSQAALGLPVDVSGMVTWSLADADFFYLQDLTGGTRVYHDRTKTGRIMLGKYLRVKGTTRAGSYSPAVALAAMDDLGSMSPPRARPITLPQAMTGQADGDWVELQGFVRNIESEGDWSWINVTTPTGDFTGHLQSPITFVANPGSLIHVHGVCENQADANGRVTGIILRVPFLHDLTIEEEAPADYFDLPRLAAADLERLSADQKMQRVRVEGTVTHAVPGRSIHLLDGDTALLLLGRDRGAVAPGDRIEAVGILGREGARTVLREVLFRKLDHGEPPPPLVLDADGPLARAADSRLVRMRGTLIELLSRGGRSRLTLQQGSSIFEATLDQAEPLRIGVGAGLELTGIYQLGYDDSRQSRSFKLQLRSPADVQVVKPPQLWTVGRALAVAGLLGGCVLLGLAWIWALRRRVRQQTTQLRQQMETQARLEADVQRATRLESLGTLAGGIAHDYNNLLTVIMGNLSLLKFNPLVMGTESERINDIEQGALRARDLSRQLLTFADGGEPLRSPCDLAAVLRAAAARAFAGASARPVFAVAAPLPLALIDQQQFDQALQNLLLHAAHASAPGGEVHLGLAVASQSDSPSALAPGEYLKVTITDHGAGIGADVLPRLFDPFFAPKQAGGGLGLATAYSIVKKHRGHLEVKSEVGRGTIFSVWVPVAGKQALASETPFSIPPQSGAGSRTARRVLLMDDEDSIRRLGVIVLQRIGLESVAVADGQAALREFTAAEQAGRPFSLLILDLTVPNGMGGKATIEAIRATGSTVPAIVCSGYSRDPVMADFARYGFQAVVTKPYELAELMKVIKRLLPEIDRR